METTQGKQRSNEQIPTVSSVTSIVRWVSISLSIKNNLGRTTRGRASLRLDRPTGKTGRNAGVGGPGVMNCQKQAGLSHNPKKKKERGTRLKKKTKRPLRDVGKIR